VVTPFTLINTCNNRSDHVFRANSQMGSGTSKPGSAVGGISEQHVAAHKGVGVTPPSQLGLWRISHDQDGEEFFWHVESRETVWDPPPVYQAWFDVHDPESSSEEDEVTDGPSFLDTSTEASFISSRSTAAHDGMDGEEHVGTEGEEEVSTEDEAGTTDLNNNPVVGHATPQIGSQVASSHVPHPSVGPPLEVLPAKSECAMVQISQAQYLPKVLVVDINQVSPPLCTCMRACMHACMHVCVCVCVCVCRSRSTLVWEKS
jgi:hypothetical protein